MTVSVTALLAKVSMILQDINNVRWNETELLGWLNDGQLEIALLAPESSTKTVVTQWVAGTKQSLPADGLRLISVVRNMGASGSTPGRAVRVVDRAVLDAQRPNWHTETASQTALHFTFDKRNPREYYVFPAQPSPAGWAEVVYSATPATVSAGQNIAVQDVYSNALLNFILYRAYLKDAEYTQNAQRAMTHYEAFLQSLGAKEPVDATVEPVMGTSRPNVTAMGG